MNQTDSNNVKRSDSENPLISLLNEKKTAFEGLSLVQLIRRDFELVVAVREAGATWEEIARFSGKRF